MTSGAGRRTLTRRQALSMVMGVYDPLGLISPALTRGKLLLRSLYGGNSPKGWDTDIATEEKKKWADWFGVLLIPAEARFPRSTKPEDAVGLPEAGRVWRCQHGGSMRSSLRRVDRRSRSSPPHGS